LTHTPSEAGKIGLALAGGGISGGIYHVGALCALEKGIDGLSFRNTDILVGVSAGAIIASCLANQISAQRLARNLHTREPDTPGFLPDLFFTPAYSRYAARGLTVPSILSQSITDFLRPNSKTTFLKSMTRLLRVVPGGVFSSKPLGDYLKTLFQKIGTSNDFRQLHRQLRIVACDLDNSKTVIFGEPPFDHIPIHEAVRASSALPGVYPPVEIEGRHYVDGILKKTVHATVPLDAGCGLVFCLNPIVPIDTVHAVEEGYMKRGKLMDTGLPGILAQTFRTLIHSRMMTGFAKYRTLYPNADLLLFEPKLTDYPMFFTNILSFSSRLEVCNHAYKDVLTQIVERKDTIEPILKRHGLRLNPVVMKNPHRDLWQDLFPQQRTISSNLQDILDELEARYLSEN
jgi:predicted acylesterase/phospholipase RssA